MRTQIFTVSDIHCSACVLLIEGELEDLGTQAVCDLPGKTVTVTYDENKIAVDDIIQTVNKCGYTLTDATN